MDSQTKSAENNHVLREVDPLKKQEEVDLDQGLSPMDPPDAYSPPSYDEVDVSQMHPFLQRLIKEHEIIKEELTSFETLLGDISKNGISRDINQKLSHFFEFFDETCIPHHQKEEKKLFPVLGQKLLEKGEHNKSEIQDGPPTTAVDLMEDDHIKTCQLAAVVFNIMSLAIQLPDSRSRIIALDTALEQGKSLVESMRLHIFREDTVLFAQAHKYIDMDEFETMEK